MRKPLRSLTAVIAMVALTLGIAVVRPLDAVANASGFVMARSGYGPNEIVTIELGALTRECDTFATTSDIYVVPAGTVGPGDALSDVSGQPNTIQIGRAHV